MVSESTGRWVPKRCGSWLCAPCNGYLRDTATAYLKAGAEDRPEGAGLGFFTLTDTAAGGMDLPELRGRLDATRKRFQREGWWGLYGGALHFQRRGALHPHLLVHVPADLVPLMRPHGQKKRARAQWRWHFNDLVPAVRELGWGPVCDAELVADSTAAARYATAALSRYATRQAHQAFKRAGARRVRPLRTSQAWAKGLGLMALRTGRQRALGRAGLNGPGRRRIRVWRGAKPSSARCLA